MIHRSVNNFNKYSIQVNKLVNTLVAREIWVCIHVQKIWRL